MVVRNLVLGAAIAMTVLSGAAAQVLVALDDDYVVPGFDRPIHVLDNYNVVDRFGSAIGDLEGFVGPNGTFATHAIVELDGIPLIQPDRCRLVPIENVTLLNEEVLALDISRERVARLPIWKETDILKSLC